MGLFRLLSDCIRQRKLPKFLVSWNGKATGKCPKCGARVEITAPKAGEQAFKCKACNEEGVWMPLDPRQRNLNSPEDGDIVEKWTDKPSPLWGLTEAERFQCDDPISHFHFAHELAKSEDYARAITHYEFAIQLDPDHLDVEVYAFAAWMLATCPKKELRAADRAIGYAREACEIGDWNESWSLTILGSAYAESEDFESAIDFQSKACEIANESYDAEFVDEMRRRLQEFTDGRTIPYEEFP